LRGKRKKPGKKGGKNGAEKKRHLKHHTDEEKEVNSNGTEGPEKRMIESLTRGGQES